MKKVLSAILLAALVLTLVACGTKNEGDKNNASSDGGNAQEEKTLVVGASNIPHAIILEKVKPMLKEEGVDLVIDQYTDYIMPNTDLDSGEIDANYFQHIPYLESQMSDHGYDFVNAGEIHIEPIGVYSKKYKSLKELPDGATILMSNSIADHGRVLAMLEAQGLIKLNEDIKKTTAEVKDIIDNPKNINFEADYEAALLPQLYNNDEGDAVLINSNYAIDAGLNPMEDSIALEDSDSPYVNVIAVRKGDEEKAEIKALINALKSKEIQDFIIEEWKGSVVPVK
ncbi:MetQ/NlpA family ABC transporter substrate-binding protein [Sporosarcina sp. 6E9]|uniref:MetQ/NlpA family ABC transporter substrate-binding protein n=1 Tax=Sporosarcina sp. 6E9 TaxID=2819235 RepID=UPI001B3049C8|nr:MetQ/NlpA family ABC transporter substrate-binding protein [Sporosarcina sp. 6E9]